MTAHHFAAGPGPGEARVRYEFRLAGGLSETARASFPELSVAAVPADGSVLFGVVDDEAHLHGLIDRFATLGLPLLEMRRLPD